MKQILLTAGISDKLKGKPVEKTAFYTTNSYEKH